MILSWVFLGYFDYSLNASTICHGRVSAGLLSSRSHVRVVPASHSQPIEISHTYLKKVFFLTSPIIALVCSKLQTKEGVLGGKIGVRQESKCHRPVVGQFRAIKDSFQIIASTLSENNLRGWGAHNNGEATH